MVRWTILWLVFGVIGVWAATASAVKLSPAFSEHMVLQQGEGTAIFGTGQAGETVRVTFADREVTTQVEQDGRWRVVLAMPEPGGPYALHIAAPSGEVHLKDVLVGEVWLLSGQSNMARGLGSQEKVIKGEPKGALTEEESTKVLTEERDPLIRSSARG